MCRKEREREVCEISEKGQFERVNVPLRWNVVKVNIVTVDLSKVSCQTEKSLKHWGGNKRGISLWSQEPQL